MIKKLKKGFTLVELIVVIAIIAILSTVAVVGYTRVVDKANVSNDTQLVRNLNERMSLYEAETGYKTPETAHDAFVLTEDFGFIIEKLTPTSSGNDIVWDMTTNRFALIDSKTHESIYTDPARALSANAVDLWKVYTSIPATSDFSIYLAGKDFKEPVNVKVGFDVGRNVGITDITYSYTGAGQNVVFRTTGGTLSVGANGSVAKGKITHYGALDNAIVYTENNSFHARGTIQNVEVGAGRIVVEEEAIIYVRKAAPGTVIEEGDGGVVVIPSDVTSADIQTNNIPAGYTIGANGTTQPADIAAKIAANQGLLGTGTENDPFQVYDFNTLQKITLFYEAGYNHFKINLSKTVNGTIDGTTWNSLKLNGSFDGSGVKFLNVTQRLFDKVGYKNNNDQVTLKNFEVTFAGAPSMIGNLINGGTTTFDRVKIHGYIEGTYHVASFYAYGTAQYGTGKSYTVEFINSESDATIVSSIAGGMTAGFIGHVYQGTGNTFTLKMDSATKFTGKTFSNGKKGSLYYVMSNNNNAIEFYLDGVKTTLNNTLPESQKSDVSLINPTKGVEGFNINLATGAKSIVVSVAPQLTAYDDQNAQIANLSGITMIASSSTIDTTSLTGDIKVFDLVSSINIVKGAETYYSSNVSGNLTLGIPGSYNYQTGVVRLVVRQYDTLGNLLATGSLDIAQRAQLTNTWTIK